MPEIEIGPEQAAYLEDVREALADAHLDGYGAMRTRDALQYLIDCHEATRDGALVPDADAPAGGDEAADGDGDGDDAEAEADAGAAERSDEDGAADGGSALQRMMSLLEENDDVWEEVDSNDGKYAVTLPDGSTTYARTQDDVRALLFEHYR